MAECFYQDTQNESNYEDSVGSDFENGSFEMVVDDPTEMLEQWKYLPHFLPSIILHIIIFCIGVTGHIIFLIYIYNSRNKHHNNTGLFLASLSGSEFLLLLVYVPLEVWKSLWTQLLSYGEGTVCQAMGFTQMLSALASVINLTAVSIERYIVVVHPIRSKFLCTKINCRIAVCFIWVLSALLSSPVLFTNSVYSIVYTNMDRSIRVEVWQCTEDIKTDPSTGRLITLYQLLCILAIPFVLTSVAYYYVIKALWRSTRNIHSLTNCDSPKMGIVKANGIRCHSFRPAREFVPHKAPASQSDSTPTGSGGQDEFNQIQVIQQQQKQRHSSSNPGKSVDRVGSSLYTVKSLERYVSAPSLQSASKSKPQGNPQDFPNRHLCSCRYYQSNQGWTAAQRINASRKKIVKMLVMILILFFLCWGVWIFDRMIKWWAINAEFKFYSNFIYFSLIAKYFPAIHATINPIVYCIMSGNFRKFLERWWRKNVIEKCPCYMDDRNSDIL